MTANRISALRAGGGNRRPYVHMRIKAALIAAAATAALAIIVAVVAIPATTVSSAGHLAVPPAADAGMHAPPVEDEAGVAASALAGEFRVLDSAAPLR